MPSTFVIPRSHLIFAVCLPLAIFVGYLLADPFDTGTISVMVLLVSVLSIPLLMRWHHPLLVFSYNALIAFYALPGNLSLWMIATAISLFFAVLTRSLGHPVRFFQVRSVAFSLLFLGLVVLVTAQLTGGIGLRSLGGATYGGRKYYTIFAAIALYFAMSVIPIKRERAGLYATLYFASMFTALVGYLAVWLAGVIGPAAYYLVQVFPIQSAVEEAAGLNEGDLTTAPTQIARLGQLGFLALGLFCLLMTRFGLRETLNISKPWRPALLALAFAAAMFSGFRSNILFLGLGMGIMFYLEGLFRTRHFPAFALAGALAVGVCLPFIDKLPLAMQRSVAFLPVAVDPLAKQSAEGSTVWRLEMWRDVLPQVPKYLIVGKGYALSPDDIYMASVTGYLGFTPGSEGAAISGDYHSGPLSVIIPFGIAGVGAFVWFLVASLKVLNQNRKFGDPSLSRINNFLFAYFIAKLIMFMTVFGSLHSDLGFFCSVVALSVCLNGGVSAKSQESTEENADDIFALENARA